MPHKPTLPFAHTSGPKDAKIAFVGEAFGEQEDLAGKPFVGSAGQELTKLLTEAGFERRQCFLTNVFPLCPLNNKMEYLCGDKATVGKDYTAPPLFPSKYILSEYLPEVDRLREELTAVSPNLIVALGNTACWALLGSGKISSIRGSITQSQLTPGLKLLPTYHPSAVLRNWAYRPIVSADLLKAFKEAQFPQIIRPSRWLTVQPTLADIFEWSQRPAEAYAVDIETYNKQITMIGFARSPSDALVVPFVDWNKANKSYWGTYEEYTAWKAVEHLLCTPVPKIFQNGLYDLQYILRMGLRVKNCSEDTMLLSHALFPEMPKGLGFLGSIFSNEASWKLLRHSDTNKKDE